MEGLVIVGLGVITMETGIYYLSSIHKVSSSNPQHACVMENVVSEPPRRMFWCRKENAPVNNEGFEPSTFLLRGDMANLWSNMPLFKQLIGVCVWASIIITLKHWMTLTLVYLIYTFTRLFFCDSRCLEGNWGEVLMTGGGSHREQCQTRWANRMDFMGAPELNAFLMPMQLFKQRRIHKLQLNARVSPGRIGSYSHSGSGRLYLSTEVL